MAIIGNQIPLFCVDDLKYKDFRGKTYCLSGCKVGKEEGGNVAIITDNYVVYGRGPRGTLGAQV